MNRRYLSCLSTLLLVFCIVITGSDAMAGPSPYFRYCNVMSKDTTTGVGTLISAEAGTPDGAVISRISVTGPGDFAATMGPGDYDASAGSYVKVIPASTPVAGEYEFTVTDTAGRSAISYYYLKKVDPLPTVDSSTMVALGDLLTPTLCWSNVNYNGNLLFMVRIVDAASVPVWTSNVTGSTFTVVPSGLLVAGTSYKWSVVALDDPYPANADNSSESALKPLVISSSLPGFNYARVYSLNQEADLTTEIDVMMTVPPGAPAELITSLVVTGPNGFSYSFPIGESSSTGRYFNHSAPGLPKTGMYTFTAQTAGGPVTSYYYYGQAWKAPLVDLEHMQASGDFGDSENPASPRFTWLAPASDRNLYYTVTIWDSSTNPPTWKWETTTPNTSCVPPVGTLNETGSYLWRVDVLDKGWPYLPNNVSRTSREFFWMDYAGTNYIWGATAYVLHDLDGISTVLDVFFNRIVDGEFIDGQWVGFIWFLNATGPEGSGFSRNFQVEDLSPAGVGEEYEYVYRAPGILPNGSYTFTVRLDEGMELLTYDVLNFSGVQIPLPDEASFQAFGNALAPTVSWNAISDYPGKLYYRLKIIDSVGNVVYNSKREPFTSQKVPAGYLQAGQNYQFRIEAQDAGAWIIYNERSQSQFLPLKVFVPQTVPGAPTDVKATATGMKSELQVTFKAPSDGGSPITSYTVTAFTAAGKPVAVKTGTSSPIKVAGLTNGQAYKFKVSARNAVGAGPQSQFSNLAIPGAFPGAPRAVKVVAGNGSATVSFSPPASDGGNKITLYTVTATPAVTSNYGSSGPGAAVPTVRTVSGKKGPIVVTGLVNGVRYAFTVKARTIVGYGRSSLPVTAVPATVPGRPAGVSATAGKKLAIVSFMPPASNGGSPIKLYTVVSIPEGKTVSGKASPLIVKGLTSGKIYKFKVTATNKVGTGPASATSRPVRPR